MGVGTVGDTYIDDLLGEYLPIQQGPVEDVLSSETDQLLYALLLELRAQRMRQGDMDIRTLLQRNRQERSSGNPERTGTYLSTDLDLDPLDTAEDWEKVDLEFVTSEVDLRFNDDIAVAFDEPTDNSRVVQYSATESPVTGIPVETSEIHAGAQEGTGGANLTIDAWD